MNAFQKLFSPKTTPTKTVVITSPTSAGGKHLEKGSTHTLDETSANALIAAGVARDPSAPDAAAERQKVLETLIPAPVEPEATPESFADLPAPFADWWGLQAEYSALHQRKSKTFDLLIAKRSPWSANFDFASVETNLKHGQKNLVIDQIFSGVFVGAVPDSVIAECEHLEDFYHRLEQAISDWRGKNSERCLVLKIEAGDLLQALNQKLTDDLQSLHNTGFQIFAERVKPLGLSEHKARELYFGSADWHRYNATRQAPSIPSLKLAYYEKGIGARSYVELPVEAIASHYRTHLKLHAEVLPLLKQAKAELARAKKASAA